MQKRGITPNFRLFPGLIIKDKRETIFIDFGTGLIACKSRHRV
jgi:hypothetical protein